eukprot:COSAG02_NODE_6849_length_3328_cov_35.645401_3_plen_194_part_00
MQQRPNVSIPPPTKRMRSPTTTIAGRQHKRNDMAHSAQLPLAMHSRSIVRSAPYNVELQKVVKSAAEQFACLISNSCSSQQARQACSETVFSSRQIDASASSHSCAWSLLNTTDSAYQSTPVFERPCKDRAAYTSASSPVTTVSCATTAMCVGASGLSGFMKNTAPLSELSSVVFLEHSTSRARSVLRPIFTA